MEKQHIAILCIHCFSERLFVDGPMGDQGRVISCAECGWHGLINGLLAVSVKPEPKENP